MTNTTVGNIELRPHKVRIRKLRPSYKWRANCTCGWSCLSWSWSREFDVLTSGLSRDQWIQESGAQPQGGTLTLAVDHLANAQVTR